jgi:hypothetical protein
MIARRFAGRSVFDRRATRDGIVMRASEVLGPSWRQGCDGLARRQLIAHAVENFDDQ